MKQTSLKFKFPQKYIPERKNFQNVDNDDAKSTYSYVRNENINLASLEPIVNTNTFSGGIRSSVFGFNNLPDVKAFQRISNGNVFPLSPFFSHFAFILFLSFFFFP